MAKNGWFRIYTLVSGFLIITLCTYAHTERNCTKGLKTPGYTEPYGDILIEYGNPLDIICVLNDKYVQQHGNHSSENLYFVRDSEIIPSEMIEILNSSSIRLHIEKPPLSSSVYTCKLKNDTTAVCLNNVIVGTKPLPVNDFECIGYNFENLTCMWTPPENYVKTTYNLTYHFPGRAGRGLQNSCPKIEPMEEDKKLSCLWTTLSDPQYRQAQRTFYFELNMENAFGTNQLNKTFSHFQHVLSGPPENLTYVSTTTESVLLRWSVPNSMQAFPPGLQHRVMYQSECWEKPFRCVERPWQAGGFLRTTTSEGMKHIQFNLTGLEYAHALYDIRVAMRSGAAEPEDESMWSRNSSITVRTASKVPGAPPRTNIGSFEDISSPLNQREVYVYWQQIPSEITNGEDFKYSITVSGSNSKIEPFELTDAYAKYTNLSVGESYTFHIWSQNSVGKSIEKSTVFVPKHSQRVGDPFSFTKIAFGGGKYMLSWEPPKQISPPLKNYTIFWCPHYRDRPYQCTGNLTWIEIPQESTSYNITVPDDEIQQFAISANTERSSSGMVWAACTIIHNQAIGKMKNVWIHFVDSTTIGLAWKLDCTDRIGSVEGFTIYYCSIVKPSEANCKGPELNFTINDPKAEFANITGLIPYETYMVAVSVKTKHGSLTQKSDALYRTTLEGAPSAPRNVEIKSVTNTSISVEWEKPSITNGVLKYYRIMYNNNTVEYNTVESEQETFILQNLTSYASYNISIVACTVECSVPSPVKFVQTKVGYPDKTTQPGVTFQNDSYILVEWERPQHPRGNNDIYEVQFKEKLQNENKTSAIVNVTGTRYVIEDCGADGKYNTFYVSVRAVNVLDGKRYEGPWSDELESFCRATPNLWIWMLVPVCFVLVLALFYMAKKMYFHCQEMRNFEVKLPPGIPVDYGLTQWNVAPKSREDLNRYPSADEEKLIGKRSSTQNTSGDSSGCSSGLESATSSLHSDTHISSTSDSGTEQPRSSSTEGLNVNSLRQRNVSGTRPTKEYVTMPADNVSAAPWNPKAAVPGSYCVLGVDPTPVANISPTYVPVSIPQTESTKMPYILPDASTHSSPYVVTGDFNKPSNSGYVPLNVEEGNEKNPAYVMTGNKGVAVPDLMRLDSIKSAEVEDKPLYVQVADSASSVRKATPDSFSWHQPSVDTVPTKTGYVSIGDAPNPRVCSDPATKGGYIPHRHFDAKTLKED